MSRMLCMHNHVLKAVQKHNTKRSWVSLCTSRAGVLRGDIHMEGRSADIENVEGRNGNDSRLKSGIMSARESQRA